MLRQVPVPLTAPLRPRLYTNTNEPLTEVTRITTGLSQIFHMTNVRVQYVRRQEGIVGNISPTERYLFVCPREFTVKDSLFRGGDAGNENGPSSLAIGTVIPR